MTVAFISDLHLSANDPETEARFQRFVDGPARVLTALHILGDLFDYWLGDAQLDWDDYAGRVSRRLAELARRGLAISLMRGNRDFMLGARFARASGATLLAERAIITLGGERVLLLHGDELCADDLRYQRVRPLLRSRAFFAIANRLPRRWRQRLANELRAKSRAHTARTAPAIMDAHPDAIARAMRAAGAKCLIHGHTHRPGTFEVPGVGIRHVLTDWQQPAPLLAWNAERGFHHLQEGGL
ncbi:MAG: UDP-2,3-diacylglucosamine diphosphatase [Casimicrobiaceae bacterium]